MEPIFKTKCSKGSLTLYSDRIIIENKTLGLLNSETLNINQITGIRVQTTVAPILFSQGAAKLTIFSKGEQKLVAQLVPCKDAVIFEEKLNNILLKNTTTNSTDPKN